MADITWFDVFVAILLAAPLALVVAAAVPLFKTRELHPLWKVVLGLLCVMSAMSLTLLIILIGISN